MEYYPEKSQDSSIEKSNKGKLSLRSVILSPGESLTLDDFTEWIQDLQSMINVVRPMDPDQINVTATTLHRMFSGVIKMNDARLISDMLLTEQLIQIKDRFDITVLSRAIRIFLAKKNAIPLPKKKQEEKQDPEARKKIARMAKDLLVKMDTSAENHHKNLPIMRIVINTCTASHIMKLLDFECDKHEGESDGMYLVKVKKIARKICEESRKKCRLAVESLIDSGEVVVDKKGQMVFSCTHLSIDDIVSRIKSGDKKQLCLCKKSTTPPERIGINSFLNIKSGSEEVTIQVRRFRMIYVYDSSLLIETDIGSFETIEGDDLEEYSIDNGYESFEDMKSRISRAPMIVEWWG